jgi:hypothetical protein
MLAIESSTPGVTAAHVPPADTQLLDDQQLTALTHAFAPSQTSSTNLPMIRRSGDKPRLFPDHLAQLTVFLNHL